MTTHNRRALSTALTILTLSLAACSQGGLGVSGASKDSPFAPAVDPRGAAVDPVLVGHRLMDAGEYELAMRAYTRAAVDQGLTPEILAGIGTANLQLGRLGQAEEVLRDALKADESLPETWNNLGVVLMERGKTAEAAQILKKAYALDNGESDAIRDNLRLALAKLENPAYDGAQQKEDFKLVRRGSNDYVLRRTP
ncbi:tetratricopeptide repeat protein [Cognatishimia sp. SS12]|uniref:tetratricopeptide repeat protein n=1 Tax=Cognatishimia sp. SS12 TaxID=2979465 RepID=UPI00232F47B8|nr:tetratricopeptide repeat protein [Cognatishimia sp. SS12]MDC0738223.1 tetratricopeptide repeat protein [Cognatishimia sp. SS12]